MQSTSAEGRSVGFVLRKLEIYLACLGRRRKRSFMQSPWVIISSKVKWERTACGTWKVSRKHFRRKPKSFWGEKVGLLRFTGSALFGEHLTELPESSGKLLKFTKCFPQPSQSTRFCCEEEDTQNSLGKVPKVGVSFVLVRFAFLVFHV